MGLYKRKVKRRDGRVIASRFWWGSYHDQKTGKFVRASTKCADKDAAREVLRGWERRAADPNDRAKDSITLRVAIAKYKKAKIRAKRSAGMMHMIDVKSAHLARLLDQDTLVRDIRARDVDTYIAKRQDEKAKDSTISKEISTLMGILKLAARHEYCDHPAALKPTSLSATSEPVTRHLRSPADLDRLLAAIPVVDGREEIVENRRAHIMFLVATAIDWTPSTLACREDIDLVAGVVRVRGTKTEYRAREVPITRLTRPMLERVLALVPESGPMFLPWMNPVRDLAVACKRAEIERVTPRDFRRTLGTWLRAMGVEPQLIAPVLGHRDGRMTERTYGKLDVGSLRNLLEARLAVAPAMALLGVHADVRESAALDANGANPAKATESESPEKQAVSSAQGRNRTADTGIFNPVLRKTLAGKFLSAVEILHSDGTPMYAPMPATWGGMMDEAVGLGAA